MGKYSSEGLTAWERITLLEPALLRAFVVAIVGALGIWGLDIADVGEKVVQTWTLLFPLLALVQGFWTRSVVSPSNQVES